MPASRTTTALPAKQTTAILAIICVSYFMVILDNSIIFTRLPRPVGKVMLSPCDHGPGQGRLRCASASRTFGHAKRMRLGHRADEEQIRAVSL